MGSGFFKGVILKFKVGDIVKVKIGRVPGSVSARLYTNQIAMITHAPGTFVLLDIDRTGGGTWLDEIELVSRPLDDTDYEYI